MVLEDLGTFLQGLGLGTVGTNLFLGKLPTTPDACIALAEYPGLEGERVMGGGGRAVEERPNVQVAVRAVDYAAARTTAQGLYAALDGATFTSSGLVKYHQVKAWQPPFFMERDENDRTIIVFNCGIVKALA